MSYMKQHFPSLLAICIALLGSGLTLSYSLGANQTSILNNTNLIKHTQKLTHRNETRIIRLEERLDNITKELVEVKELQKETLKILLKRINNETRTL